jgi:hypothetical protein
MTQYARPSSDIAAGSWGAQPTGSMWANLDEETPSSDEVVRLPVYTAVTGDIFKVGLSAISQPSSTSGVILRATSRRGGLSGTNVCSTRFHLASGSTVFASSDWHTEGATAYNAELTLTETQVNAITTANAWGSLEFWGEGTQASGGRYCSFWQAVLEAPDSGPTIITAAGTLAGAGDLTGAARLLMLAAAALAGSGTMTGTARLICRAAGTLAGAGDLQGAVKLLVLAAAVLAGSGQMQGAALLIRLASASLVGAGELTATARLIALITAVLVGAGELTATARLYLQLEGALERTLVVPFEDRCLRANIEDRTLVVPAESRTLVVPVEDRTLVVPFEDRTLEVQ